MWEDLKDLICIISSVCIVGMGALTIVAYFDGHAKSAYLKQTQNIDIPWYHATWLNVNVQSVDARVQAQTEPKQP